MSDRERSRGDEALLAGLLAGRTLKAAAEEANVSYATARRRLADPGFRAMLDEGRREAAAAAVAALAGLAELAIETQRDLLLSSETPPAVKRSVARDVLAALGELGVSRDLEARLEELEKAAGFDPRTGWRAA